MDPAELRDAIWDYLFEAQGSRTLDEIAAFADQDRHAIHAAVDHEWFTVAHDRVSIAYASGPVRSDGA
jgi:hypothetical protein